MHPFTRWDVPKSLFTSLSCLSKSCLHWTWWWRKLCTAIEFSDAPHWTMDWTGGDLHPLTAPPSSPPPHPTPPWFERLGLLERLHGTHVVTVGLDFTPIKHGHKTKPDFHAGALENYRPPPSVQTQKHVRPPGGLPRLKSLLQSAFISTHSWSNYWRVHVGWRPFKVGCPRWKHDCSIRTPFYGV